MTGFQDCIAKPLCRKSLGELLARWVPAERRHSPEGEDAPAPALDPALIDIPGADGKWVRAHQPGGLPGDSRDAAAAA